MGTDAQQTEAGTDGDERAIGRAPCGTVSSPLHDSGPGLLPEEVPISGLPV